FDQATSALLATVCNYRSLEHLILVGREIEHHATCSGERHLIAQQQRQLSNGAGFREGEQLLAVCFCDVVGDELQLRPADPIEPLTFDIEHAEATVNLRQGVSLPEADACELRNHCERLRALRPVSRETALPYRESR